MLEVIGIRCYDIISGQRFRCGVFSFEDIKRLRPQYVFVPNWDAVEVLEMRTEEGWFTDGKGISPGYYKWNILREAYVKYGKR